ncbi:MULTISPECIES: hypothetical protein [Methylobacterium]|uniref:Uncharacterized protein n=1 Tax=Methylobacterium thuringiense TaxID=1003091 RepID=A0ABQ4TF57_9HYPH|nr:MULTISPECIES: hypothetical protein [Methylobacterium]GJE54013.1 hypothetical protein EKPJFOCH_0485 [Methylobacterium thuringiense]
MRMFRWMIVAFAMLGGAVGISAAAHAAPLPATEIVGGSVEGATVSKAYYYGRRGFYGGRRFGYGRPFYRRPFYGYRRPYYRRPFYGYRRPYYGRRFFY